MRAALLTLRPTNRRTPTAMSHDHRRFARTRVPALPTPAPVDTTAAPLDHADLVTPEVAALMLGCSASTLAKWRCLRSDGPRYVKLGARTVRCPVGELRAWVARQGLRTHTHGRPE